MMRGQRELVIPSPFLSLFSLIFESLCSLRIEHKEETHSPFSWDVQINNGSFFVLHCFCFVLKVFSELFECSFTKPHKRQKSKRDTKKRNFENKKKRFLIFLNPRCRTLKRNRLQPLHLIVLIFLYRRLLKGQQSI